METTARLRKVFELLSGVTPCYHFADLRGRSLWSTLCPCVEMRASLVPRLPDNWSNDLKLSDTVRAVDFFTLDGNSCGLVDLLNFSADIANHRIIRNNK